MGKSYAETHGAETLNWDKELAYVSSREFSKLDGFEKAEYWLTLKTAAGSWISCACGTQSNLIPREANGTPIDQKLYHLGVDFYEAMTFGSSVKEAKKYLRRIKRRARYLVLIQKIKGLLRLKR